MVQWKNAGGLNKNIKNSLLAMPVLRTCRECCGMSDFKPRLESATPHHQRRPPLRGRWHRQKDKKPLAFGEKPTWWGRDTLYPSIIIVLY